MLGPRLPPRPAPILEGKISRSWDAFFFSADFGPERAFRPAPVLSRLEIPCFV